MHWNTTHSPPFTTPNMPTQRQSSPSVAQRPMYLAQSTSSPHLSANVNCHMRYVAPTPQPFREHTSHQALSATSSTTPHHFRRLPPVGPVSSSVASDTPPVPHETPEERDLRLALLASLDDHEQHAEELQKREAEMIQKIRQESQMAEAERIAMEKARLASLEETEERIMEGVLLESRLVHQKRDHHASNRLTAAEDMLALELALAMSLSDADSHQPARETLWNSLAPSLPSEHRMASRSPIPPLRPVHFASNLSHTHLQHSRPSFASSSTLPTAFQPDNPPEEVVPAEIDYCSRYPAETIPPHVVEPRTSSNSSSLDESPPPYVYVESPISNTSSQSVASSHDVPTHATVNPHPSLQVTSTPGDEVGEPRSDATQCDVRRRVSRPLPQVPSLPYPPDASGSPAELEVQSSLHWPAFNAQATSPSIEIRTRPTSSLGFRLSGVSYDCTPTARSRSTSYVSATDPFSDCYAALLNAEQEGMNDIRHSRPPLMIRTRSDHFLPFPNTSETELPIRPSIKPVHEPPVGNPQEDENEDDEGIKQALMRARRPSTVSGSFVSLENDESDVFGTSEGHGSPVPVAERINSSTFNANPRPSPSMLEGIQFGLVRKLNNPLDSNGQFPDVIALSRYARDGTTTDNPLFAIEAWSWNQLLTYFMWHGNSRIEAGPLDVAEAEECNTPARLALFVQFTANPSPKGVETSVRLIMEYVSALPDVKRLQHINSRQSLSSTSVSSGVPSSTSIKSASITSTTESSGAGGSSQLIQLPKPYLDLPISLATLASVLHEIHAVARMTSCSTSSFRGAKPGVNTETLKKLAKAIQANAKAVGEGAQAVQNEERLVKRGRIWLRRKRKGLMGDSGGNETDRVAGEGLPLPAGATLVQPWDSDWS